MSKRRAWHALLFILGAIFGVGAMLIAAAPADWRGWIVVSLALASGLYHAQQPDPLG